MQMKSVVSLGDGEEIWCADLDPLEYSFCISSVLFIPGSFHENRTTTKTYPTLSSDCGVILLHCLSLHYAATPYLLQSYLTLCDPYGLQPARLFCPRGSLVKSTRVGCHTLLRGSSQPMDRTRVSCVAGRFFTTKLPGEP